MLLVFLYFPPTEVASTPINLTTIFILSSSHAMVLGGIDHIITAFRTPRLDCIIMLWILWMFNVKRKQWVIFEWDNLSILLIVMCDIMLRRLINEVSWILDYFGSAYSTDWQVGNVINIGEILPNFWKSSY